MGQSGPGMMISIPPITLLDLALRGGLVACLVLLAGLLLRGGRRAVVALLGAWLALGLAAYVGVNAPGVVQFPRPAWQAPLLALGAGNPVVFWWFCRALFDDGCRWRARHALPWLGMVLLALLQCLWLGPARVSGTVPAAAWVGRLQDALPLLFALLALREALATWRDDLVERRRQLRWFIVLAGVAYTGVELAGRLWLAPSAPAGTRDVALLAGIVALVAWRMLEVPASDLFGPVAVVMDSPGLQPAAPPAAATATRLAAAPRPALQDAGTVSACSTSAEHSGADTQLAADLHTLMAEARIYREDQLTIGGLAARLGVPEYRLRRLINQRLGHRNFNAFVNRWRLGDAQQALLDPLRAQEPVLRIALDAGFQSIGPFNRAFKAYTGLTPTDFRRQRLAGGGTALADS